VYPYETNCFQYCSKNTLQAKNLTVVNHTSCKSYEFGQIYDQRGKKKNKYMIKNQQTNFYHVISYVVWLLSVFASCGGTNWRHARAREGSQILAGSRNSAQHRFWSHFTSHDVLHKKHNSWSSVNYSQQICYVATNVIENEKFIQTAS